MDNSTDELVEKINQSFGIALRPGISMDQLKAELSAYVHDLIGRDFNKLVSLLYRIDVNENKLRRLLDANAGGDAGNLIAELIIERQLQKARSRQESRGRGENNIDENEKW